MSTRGWRETWVMSVLLISTLVFPSFSVHLHLTYPLRSIAYPLPFPLPPSLASWPSTQRSCLCLSLTGETVQLANLLNTLSATPSAEILDALRSLERKTSLVFTLLKASVYSIVLQQQIIGEEGDGAGDDTRVGGVEGRGEDEDGL